MLLHYLGKLKIFCRYSADIEENANKLHFNRLKLHGLSTINMVFSDEDKILVKVCIWRRLSSWLNTKSLNYCLNVFFSGGTVRSAAAWPPVNCSWVPQLFNSLLTPRFIQLLSGNSPINLFAVYPFKYKLFLSKFCPWHWILQWRLLLWISGATNWLQENA